MPIPTAKLARAKSKLRCKLDGSTVVIHYQEWPAGVTPPAIDPTTGARVVADGDPEPVLKTASVRAFVHIANPITSGYRRFAEVQAGDAIVDFPLDLIKVTDAGDTDLTVGQIVDEIAFSQANRGVEDTALGISIEPSDLENVSMEFGGHTWVQKEVGEELIKNWDTLYAGLNITRAMLMTTTK